MALGSQARWPTRPERPATATVPPPPRRPQAYIHPKHTRPQAGSSAIVPAPQRAEQLQASRPGGGVRLRSIARPAAQQAASGACSISQAPHPDNAILRCTPAPAGRTTAAAGSGSHRRRPTQDACTSIQRQAFIVLSGRCRFRNGRGQAYRQAEQAQGSPRRHTSGLRARAGCPAYQIVDMEMLSGAEYPHQVPSRSEEAP
jgi:hypothetical protein